MIERFAQIKYKIQSYTLYVLYAHENVMRSRVAYIYLYSYKDICIVSMCNI